MDTPATPTSTVPPASQQQEAIKYHERDTAGQLHWHVRTAQPYGVAGFIDFCNLGACKDDLYTYLHAMERKFIELGVHTAQSATPPEHVSYTGATTNWVPITHQARVGSGTITFRNTGLTMDIIHKCVDDLIKKFPELVVRNAQTVPPVAPETKPTEPPASAKPTEPPAPAKPAKVEPEPEPVDLHLKCYAWTYVRAALEALADAAGGRRPLDTLTTALLSALYQVSGQPIHDLGMDLRACATDSTRVHWNGMCWVFKKHATARMDKSDILSVFVCYIAEHMRPMIGASHNTILLSHKPICLTTFSMKTDCHCPLLPTETDGASSPC